MMCLTGAMAWTTGAQILTLAAFIKRTTAMTTPGSAVLRIRHPISVPKLQTIAPGMMAHVTSMLTTAMAYSTGAQILNLIRSAAIIQRTPAETETGSVVTPTPPVLKINGLAILIDNN